MSSSVPALDQGVPQVSCPRPIMFTQYCSPIFSVINVHGKDGHGYTEHQVYSGCDPVFIASVNGSIARISSHG